MIAQKRLSEQWYVELIKYVSSTLSLSLTQIQNQYSKHHLCIIDSIAKDIHQKSIEIRLSKEEITLTCFFDSREDCVSTFLFPDDIKLIDDFVGYLTEYHDYSFVQSRFSLDNCFLEVQSIRELEENICLEFYQ